LRGRKDTVRSRLEFRRRIIRSHISDPKQSIIARSFEEEFIAFLKKHGVEYDPQYVWG